MPLPVAEHVVRSGLFRRPSRLRVDLHGVSVFGPGDRRRLVRWEWIERIDVAEGVAVIGGSSTVHLPAGAFAIAPAELAERLRSACDPNRRADEIATLRGHQDED